MVFSQFQQIGVEQIVKGNKKFLKDMQAYDKSMGRATRVTEDHAKKSSRSFSDVAKSMAVVAGGAVALGIALKKVWEIGKQGAVIRDAAASFERLAGSTEEAVEWMEELDAAALGTISKVGLMSVATKLLAGTTGDLRTSFRNASPALLTMAKAAIKLDPTLGTVDHAFMSLVAGIKKGQPLLIDNTNAIVSVGDANKEYAKKLGITVAALTEVDKQQALLEETLRAGDVMIEQVGGSVETLGDEFARSEAEIKNATDAAKGWVSIWVGGALSGLRKYTEGVQGIVDAFKDQSIATAMATGSYEDFAKQMKIVKSGMGPFGRIVRIAEEDQWALWKALNAASGAIEHEARMLGLYTPIVKDAVIATKNLYNEWKFGREAIENAASGVGMLSDKMLELSNTTMPELETSTGDLTELFGDLTREMLFTHAAAGLTGEKALELAKAMGLVNIPTEIGIGIADEIGRALQAEAIGAIAAAEALSLVKFYSENITDKEWTFTTILRTVEEGGVGRKTSRTVTGRTLPSRPPPPTRRHSGLDTIIGPGFPNDSLNLESINVESGERLTITPAAEVRNPGSTNFFSNDRTSQNEYNLTVMTSQAPTAVVRSFEMMKLLGG